MIFLLGCKDDPTQQDEVFSDAARRVEKNLLPPIRNESEAVLRNLVHLLTALPQLCSTGLANIGSFVSGVPALGAPDTITFDGEDGTWEIGWLSVVLGDDDGQLTNDTDTPRVNLTLTVQFLSQPGQILRAVPFSLIPQSPLQTGGEPPSFAAGSTEGFFLFQDATTGAWTLRWRAVGSPKVFEGRISAPAVSRVIRRLAGSANTVTSLAVDTVAREIRFMETTDAGDENGFTFFVRPGESIRFRLRLGNDEDALQGITRSQLRIGAGDQALPIESDPAEFILASNLPIAAVGAPVLNPGTVLGTFIWQDTSTNTCTAGVEDQWRMRFSKQSGQTAFSGTISGFDDDADQARLRVTAVGCPDGTVDDGGRRLTYDCTLTDDTLRGYDICVTSGKRLSFTPAVDDIGDPGLVFIGAAGVSPPSPDPFEMLFDVDLAEQGSSRNLVFSEGRIFLRGNDDENEDRAPLNADQVSLEPLCSIPAEQLQPRVRLEGDGDYSTERFEGSRYNLEHVEFTDANVSALDDFRRFLPDAGEIRLETRVDTENTTTTMAAQKIENVGSQAQSPVDIEMAVNDVLFTFLDQLIDLTVE